MGSLKDAIRGPLEDHQHCERTEDEEHPGSSIGDPTTDNLPVNTSQLPTSGNSQPNVHTTTNCEEKEDKSGTPKAKYISGETYGEDSASNHVKDCTQMDCVTPAPQTAAEPLEPLAVESKDAPSPAANEPSVAAAQQANGTEEGRHADRDAGKDGQTARPVLPAQHPLVPGSPAPSGQQHMHTQVSLEVVQCHSAATSPMTPPEGDQAFFFPLCYGRPGAAEAQSIDAELQAGRQVEFRSVATAPMTPRTPVATTFPEMGGGGAERQREGAEQARCVTEMVEVSNSVPTGSEGCRAITEDGHPEGRQHVQRMVSRDQDITILVTHHGSNEEYDEEGETQVESTLYPIGPENADDDGDGKGSGAKEATEERVDVPDGAWSVGRVRGPTANVPQTKITTKDATVLPGDDPETDKQCQHSGFNGTKEEVSEEPRAQPQAPQHESTLTQPPIPGSPAPSGSSHHMHTQVSLEVVQCHSVATSPMTPPDGEHTFFFPNACDRSEMRDAEMQVGRRVEFRSVATAPMTPRTPTTPMGFPEVRREERKEENVSEEKIIGEKTPEEKISEENITEDKISEEKISENVLEQKTSVENMLEQNISEKITEEKILWEEEVSKKTEPMATERATADTALPSTEDTTAGRIVEEKTADGEAEEEEKYEEPVQEVSWDEKGMTWEVYGAVVEVSVLGTAIQKHLEKQVKKQRKQPSLPPPPPLNPAALPLPPASPAGRRAGKREREAKAGRRRRNPFRLLLQNIQQPQCCSRAHTSD